MLFRSPESEGPPPPCVACAAEARGRGALHEGDTSTAQLELADARRVWASLDAAWPVARVELALAQAGLRDHARSALDFFESVGAVEEIEQARSLLS